MRAAVACLGTVLVPFASASAQEPPPDVRAELGPDDKPVRLVTSFSRKSSARLHVGKARPVALHAGEAAGTIVAGHGRLIVAVSVDDEEKPFRVHVLKGEDPGDAAAVARPVRRRDVPFAVAGTATPEGFALFFQEVQGDDPSAARTYLVRLDREGRPQGAATELPVPWSLAAAIWNGDGYHLALFYPGDAQGMRLSMVSLSKAGQPQQHPDWASAAGFISDVHLRAQGGRIVAFYRSGERLLESDVTAIRSWGSEPPRARDHGALPSGKVIALARDGRPVRVERPAAR